MLTFEQFQATKRWCDDLRRAFPDDVWETGGTPTPQGYAYIEALYIERVQEARGVPAFKTRAEFEANQAKLQELLAKYRARREAGAKPGPRAASSACASIGIEIDGVVDRRIATRYSKSLTPIPGARSRRMDRRGRCPSGQS
jgi:hypothetical protein